MPNVVEIIVQAADKATATFRQVGDSAKQLGSNMASAGDRFVKAGDAMSNAGMRLSMLSVPLLGIGIAAIKTASDYQTSMNVLQAVSGATSEEMAKLDQLAIDLGADMSLPATSAKNAADAMQELAKSGLSVNQIMGASKGVLQLAAAGQLSEAEAAEIAANALNAFGLRGEEAIRVADLLAASANASSAEVVDMALAMKMSAAVFSAAKLPIEDLITSLGIMANAGIKNSDAGTSMKTMLLSLQTPTKEQSQLMKRLAFGIYDASGNMKSMRDIISNLAQGVAGLTQEERDRTLGVLFGSDAVRAANVLLAAGAEGFDKMKNAVTKEGAAAELAAARTKGLGGAIEGLKSQLETALLRGGSPVLEMLEDMARGAADLVGKFMQLPAPVQKAAALFALIVGISGPAILILGKMTSGFGAMLGMVAKVPAVFSLAGKAIGAIPAVLGLLTGPIGIAMLAAGALGLAWATNLGGMRDALEPVVKAVGDGLGKIGEMINNFLGGLGLPKIEIGVQGPPESRLHNLSKEMGRNITPVMAEVKLEPPSSEETTKLKAEIAHQISPILVRIEIPTPKIEALEMHRLEILPPDTSVAEQAMSESNQRIQAAFEETGEGMQKSWDATWGDMRPIMERRGAELLDEASLQTLGIQTIFRDAGPNLREAWESGLGQVKEGNKVVFDAIDMDIQGRMLVGEAIIKAGLKVWEVAWSVGLGLLEGITTGKFGDLNRIIGDLMGSVGANLGQAWADIMANVTQEWNAWLANIRTAWDNFRQFMTGGQAQAQLPPEVPIIPRVFGISLGMPELPRLPQAVEAMRSPRQTITLPTLKQSVRLIRERMEDIELPMLNQAVRLVRERLPNLALPSLKQRVETARERIPPLLLPPLRQALEVVRGRLSDLVLNPLRQVIRLAREKLEDVGLPALRQVVRLIRERAEYQPMSLLRLPPLRQVVEMTRNRLPDLALNPLRQVVHLARERLSNVNLPPLVQAIRTEHQPIFPLRPPPLRQVVETMRRRLPDLALRPLGQAVKLIWGRLPDLALKPLIQVIKVVREKLLGPTLPPLSQTVRMERQSLSTGLSSLSQTVTLLRDKLPLIALPSLRQRIEVERGQVPPLLLPPSQQVMIPRPSSLSGGTSSRWAENQHPSMATPERQSLINVTFTGDINLPNVRDAADLERWARQQGIKAASIYRSPGR